MRRWLLALPVLCLAVPLALADDWPQWLGPQRDGVWREKGILDKFPKDGPKVRWRADTGAGYSGPAVAAGRVFLTDFVADAGAKQPGAFDEKTPYAGRERVLCLGAADGKPLWK